MSRTPDPNTKIIISEIPCKNGHYEFYASSRRCCVECKRQRQKEKGGIYYERQKEARRKARQAREMVRNLLYRPWGKQCSN